jgi:uncharacterized protein (DUF362 family)
LSTSEAKPVFSVRRQGSNLSAAVSMVLEEVSAPQRGDTVFVKPNFTYPYEKPGVTTTRAFLVALVEGLKDRGVDRICIGEGEGGYNAFSMDETFQAFELDNLAARYGITYANVNRWPSKDLIVEHHGRTYNVRFPAPILSDFDSFISAPVPKVHCMTTISCAVKNQWGLVQDLMRLRLHIAFEPIVAKITETLGRAIVVCDGSYGLTRNGPMVDGEALELGWVAGSNNFWLHDLMMCRIMRFQVSEVSHLQYALRHGLAPAVENCALSAGWENFVDERFYLRRNAWNRLAKITWYSPSLNHLVYTSRASGALHKAMYAIRNKSPDLQARGVDWK